MRSTLEAKVSTVRVCRLLTFLFIYDILDLFLGVCVYGSVLSHLIPFSLFTRIIQNTVRLFGQGLDIVEVSDDGCGVPPASRPLLATRYATSKIQTFDDIYKGTGLSMGFRGEALFSLACLSQNMVVATRCAEEPVATKLEYRRDGSLDLASLVELPRKIGTTVAVVKLFHALPARQADMARRIKPERAKLFRLMEACTFF
jgi:DNA mismatch repair protein PMS2